MMAERAPSPEGRLDEFCRNPYRLLFPLGVALSWAGVSHWALHAAGLFLDYRPRFHAMAQTQGFMTCMALGFLFTMIPRLTGTAPPRPWQLLAAMAGPVAVVLAAWNSRWIVAQLLWLLLALMVVEFIARRFNGTGESRVPNGFVWIPTALSLGVAGSAVALLSEVAVLPLGWALVGQRMVQQGFFVSLILGVGGSVALPLMTRGEQPVTSLDRVARAGHLLGAGALAASFWVEVNYSLQFAMAIRATVTFGVLVGAADLWRLPQRPGANARIIWFAAWLVPLGYLAAALMPLSFRAGLHVTLIGGFALLSLVIAAQVLLGHGGYPEIVRGWPVSALVLCACMSATILARALMELDRARSFGWMGLAAGLYLVGTIAWARYVSPNVLRPRRPE
jgi:hypothetical protein|tara:strand:+ start:893 stop:2071 length:1179 start_codon:yes stop_codon:yes gene_type:complete